MYPEVIAAAMELRKNQALATSGQHERLMTEEDKQELLKVICKSQSVHAHPVAFSVLSYSHLYMGRRLTGKESLALLGKLRAPKVLRRQIEGH